MTSIDHARCSELLAPFVQGRLDDSSRRAVEQHVASCEQCRAEQRALEHLLSPAADPLTDLERARLHREVWDAVAPATAPPKRSLGARLTPYLGTAAVLAILAVGIVTAGGGDGDDDSGGGDGGATVFDAVQPESGTDGSAPYSEEDGDAARGLQDDALVPNAGGADAGEAEQSTTNTESSTLTAAPEPVFKRRAGTITARRLDDRGSGGYPFVDYSGAFTAAEARDRARGYLDRLAAAAGPQRNDVLACGNTVLEQQDDLPLAAFGALGDFESRPVLVVGFAASEDGQTLDAYTIWVFARGDCDRPVEIRSGAITG